MDELRYENADIDARIKRSVAEMGFEVMTPIQAQAIPELLAGKDIIGQAQTGTGKTAAFGIPILSLAEPCSTDVQAIVLCPTRELAIQAAQEMRSLAKYMEGIKVLPVYGGQDINKQIRSLGTHVQVVVGTPGRVMDHMRRHTLKLGGLKMVVLDEADEMLNMGFREDIETILKEIPAEHQTALFSATMPQEILDITHEYQKADAVHVKIQAKELTIPLVKQYYYKVSHKNKEEVVARLLDYYNPKRSLIFCNTKRMVDELAESLAGRGYFAEGLHGDLSQMQRDRVMAAFRTGTTEILIATDVAARGIDVDDVEAVFNYDVPQDIEYYVHRIGRTGRAGRTGRSFTLVTGRDIYKVREIERACNTKIKARTVPSAADITAAKSDKILSEILEVMRSQPLDNCVRMIEAKLEDEDCTALELAAAFLKQKMGQEIVDLPEEPKRDRKRGRDGEGGREGKRNYGYSLFLTEEDGGERKSKTRKKADFKRDGERKGKKADFKRDGERKGKKADFKHDGERKGHKRIDIDMRTGNVKKKHKHKHEH